MLDAYYLEIDELPLQAWIDCNKGRLTAARRTVPAGQHNYFKRSGKQSEKNDHIAWGKLYDDFLKKVGLGEEFEELTRLIRERIELSIDYLEDLQNGKRVRSKLNAINALTAEIDLITKRTIGKKGGETSVVKILNKIASKRGFHTPVDQLTTLGYFDLLRAFNAGEL